MEFLEHTTSWVKGDIFQGKIMLVTGTLFLIISLAIFKGNHSILKGMIIPLSLGCLILLGYGSVLTFTRPGHLVNIKNIHAENPNQAAEQEFEKAQRDHKNYAMLTPIWVALIGVSALMLYVLNTDFLKGLSMGLVALFLTALLVDTLLHHRLKPYHDALQTIINEK